MKIVGIDIGSHTKDILLYDTDLFSDNCLKMVVPSPTLTYAKMLSQIDGDVYINGCTIGGGHLKTIIKKHLNKGYKRDGVDWWEYGGTDCGGGGWG